MKKIILFICMLLTLTSCSIDIDQKINRNDRYYDMISLLETNQKFQSKSEFFEIEAEISKIDDGYRYYVIIDSPHVALYNIEAIAIEDGVDYSTVMASNVGIFEDITYNLIPNQTNVDKGYVKGLSISGVSQNENVTLKVLVLWQDKSLTNTYKEYFKFNIKYSGAK